MEAVCKYNTKVFLFNHFFFLIKFFFFFTLCCRQKVNDSVIRFVLKFSGLLLDLSKSEVFAELYNILPAMLTGDITVITA